MTDKRQEPRIAFFDIETSPMIVAAFELYEANAVWVERDTHLLSFAVKWSDQKTVKTYALPDYAGYKKDPYDDKALASDLWKIMDEADIIIAHNGDAFDIKKANARFIVHGLTPPEPFKSIDTLKISKGAFKFDSNKLDNIGRYLGVGRKIPHTGGKLWRDCLNGDPKAWRLMRRYNAQDVALLERVYLKVRPWAKNHPDLNRWLPVTRLPKEPCPVCQSGNTEKRGFDRSKVRLNQRHQCRDCGGWFCTPIQKKNV